MQRRNLLTIFLVPAALCAVWTVLAGKDVNWDLLNYHYYLPYELVGSRLGLDFFAASGQSYLNPVGYLPFYLMVAAGWHSLAASVTLAVAHSTSLALLYLLAWRLFAHLPHRERVVLCLLATALGGATSVWWAMVGASFLDPLLVPPVLAGLALLLEGGPRPARRAALAGALFGAAAALKYSNVIYALAALPLALSLPGLARAHRLRAGLAYAAGGTAAVALLAGPWHAALWREFGNPVFPMLNAWFQSPHALPINLAGGRFAPGDLAAAAAFPFRMALLDRSLYTETFAPDFRFAALAVVGVALAAAALRRRAPDPRALRGADWRVLGFFAAAAALWLASSANARYGLAVLLLAGVVLARLTERLLPRGAARVALAALLAVQLAASIVAAHPRWYLAEPWTRHWLPYAPPERALREPALYLSIEIQSMSVVAPFLHPDSAFVNFRGQHSLPSDSPRLAALLERYRGRVRALGRGLELVDGRPRAQEVAVYDATLRRIGYRVDAGDCFAIAWRRDDEDALSRAANRLALGRTNAEPLSVASCALRPQARDPADAEAERRMSALFDRIEKACPGLFRGQTAVTEPLGASWSRNYSAMDLRLEVHGDRAIANRYYRGGTLYDLGALQDWERGAASLPPQCGEARR
jgi:hypothetical protein